jgi:hypothetical protein
MSNIVVPEYGMFTEQGDYEVFRIVDLAKRARLTWHQVSGLLQQLADNPAYEEAGDTVVRERVWEELKYE